MKVLLKFTLIITFLLFFSCKKNELISPSSTILNETKTKFFTTTQPISLNVKKVYDYLQKLPDSKILEIASFGGIPIWNKALDNDNFDFVKNNANRNQNVDSTATIIIPLVLETQEKVNGFFEANISDTIVSLKIFIAKDYKQFNFGKLEDNNFNAEKFVYNYLVLNKEVFGDLRYKIKDSSLFKTIQHYRTKKRELFIDFKQSNTTTHFSSRDYKEPCYIVRFMAENGCKWQNVANDCTPTCDFCDDCLQSEMVCPQGGGGGGGSTIYLPPSGSGLQIGGGGNSLISNNEINETGWEPVKGTDLNILNHATVVNTFINELSLTKQESLWLKLNPTFAAELVDLHNDGMANSYNIKCANGYSEQDIATIATRLTLIDKRYNLARNGTFTQSDYDELYTFLPSEIRSTIPFDTYAMYFALEYVRLKIENPDWSEVKLYYEASKEAVHILLDGFGLVPVFGEIFDITSGILYILDGDYKNATIAFTQAIPLVGWGTTVAKYAVKVVVVSVGTGGGVKIVKSTYQFFKNAANKILFKRVRSQQLRKLHGLLPGDPRQVHHLIPVNLCEDVGQVVIQKAAGSKNAFHVDDLFNGIPLGTAQHMGSHPNYDARVKNAIKDIFDNNGGVNINPDVAYTKLLDLTNRIKTALLASPTTKVDDLIF